MDDRGWKNISIGLGVICALLIGVAGALMFVGHRGGGNAAATTSPASVAASASKGGAGTPTVATSGSGQSHAPTPPPGPTGPTGSPGKASPATVAFTGLGLDAPNDTKATTRTFTFISDGPGPVTFAVTKISAGGTAKLCINVDGGAFACKVGTPSKLPSYLTPKADTAHSTWSVTLMGYGSSAPTVDFTFTWPSAAPKVTFTHGRFQGSPDQFNGFTATFKPRAAGTLNVQSTWNPITTDASMTLYDVTTATPVTVDPREYKAVTFINPPFTATVDPAKTYQVKMRRTSADSAERPDLTAQITFP